MAHPLSEYAAPIMAAAENRRKREDARLQSFERLEPCLALSPPTRDGTGERPCYIPAGHTGPHTWERKDL